MTALSGNRAPRSAAAAHQAPAVFGIEARGAEIDRRAAHPLAQRRHGQTAARTQACGQRGDDGRGVGGAGGIAAALPVGDVEIDTGGGKFDVVAEIGGAVAAEGGVDGGDGDDIRVRRRIGRAVAPAAIRSTSASVLLPERLNAEIACRLAPRARPPRTPSGSTPTIRAATAVPWLAVGARSSG